jgi:glycosyltransferase involved in cell wall biosynthesis
MTKSPLVTFVLLSYNQEEFIQEALRSAFAQTYERLEIVISDDCSSDKTYAIIKKEVCQYHGPHRVIINQNSFNKGLAANINCALELANGLFFVMAAGDDISTPGRTEALVRRWQDKTSPVDLVCSYFEEINCDGKSTGFVKKNVMFVPDMSLPVERWQCGATGACASYDRKLYEKYGPLDPDVIAEDWIFSFRAWLESGLACIESPLVKHRTHDNSISVIHKDFKKNKAKSQRRLIMRKASNGTLARAKEWLRAWRITHKVIDDHISTQLEQWKALLEIECAVYTGTRMNALKLTTFNLYKGGGLKRTAKIFLRHVIRHY